MQTHPVNGVVSLADMRSPVSDQMKMWVAIASPVHLLRESLAASLRGRPGLALVDAVDLDPRGLAKIAETKPDIVLVDLGQTTPATAARLIKEASPGSKLVAFALDETGDQVLACAAAGFCGYVPRHSSAEDLHSALFDAMAGRMHCAPHIAAAMFSRLAGLLREPEPAASLPPLSSAKTKSSRSSLRAAPIKKSRVSSGSAPPPSRTTCTTSCRSCKSAAAARPLLGCACRMPSEPASRIGGP